ncbi:hypothetical protein BIZ78_gp136 [Erwinia phage vB_EamM_Caitlin]|uniref:hypothetical protein n=1 Tax=Erwinia phage vB_EamM_Caitlin TaxID=1883379 RepID=UPI00081D077F|nr:hypothetical protein BIZ78_gp136 [Erwinia phage vB_EamM_Caitlin]ANZ48439.1 hypothetical protein CAITLIN_144 [Erwinia phage vB_EamM_Caitlin]
MTPAQRNRLNELRANQAARQAAPVAPVKKPVVQAAPKVKLSPEQRLRLEELRNKRATAPTVAVAVVPVQAKTISAGSMTPAQRARLDELRANQQQRVSTGTHPMSAATERLNALRDETHNLGIIGTINEMTRIVEDTARQIHEDNQMHFNVVDHQNHMNHLMMSQ